VWRESFNCAVEKVKNFENGVEKAANGAGTGLTEIGQGMLTEAVALPVAWVQTAEQMSEACHEYAGGVDGVLMAAN
jgi:hypothetical protein